MATSDTHGKEALPDPATTLESKKKFEGQYEFLAPPNAPRRRFGRFSDEVKMDRVDVIPLACALISGFVDSTMFNAFGTFVSMQTGNTIFVGLGASDQSPGQYGWAKSLMAVICFCIGSFAFGRGCRYLGPRRRGSLALSFLVQALLVLVAAVLAQTNAVDGQVPSRSSSSSSSSSSSLSGTVDWTPLAPIALLSFQSAGQIVEARNLGINEVPTVVITSLLCDLWSDPLLLAPVKQNVRRNRRVVAFVLTISGAIAGGWMSKATHTVASALWLVAALKLVIVGVWVFWPKAEEKAKS